MSMLVGRVVGEVCFTELRTGVLFVLNCAKQSHNREHYDNIT